MIEIRTYLDGIVLSCDLNEVMINTSSSYLDVSFIIENKTVLSERFYAYDNIVTIQNLAELFELEMRNHVDVLFKQCSLQISSGDESVTKTFNMFFCDKELGINDPNYFFKNNFLTLARYVRIKPDEEIRLRWYDAEDEDSSYSIDATYINEVGEYERCSYGISITSLGQQFKSLIIDVEELSDMISHDREKVIQLVSFSISVGSRSITFVIDRELTSARQFVFVNCFNQFECISINGITKEKLSTESSLANVSHHIVKYDVSHVTEYETETAPLSSDEELLLCQMLTSYSVMAQLESRKVSFDALSELIKVVITSYTCDLSDSLGELNKVKFSWRPEKSVVRIKPTSSNRIFDNNYNKVFS